MIDYMVMEAVAIRVRKRDEQDQKEAAERQRREEFKKGAKQALGHLQ